jgi:trk system potassium uptake protein TrkA
VGEKVHELEEGARVRVAFISRLGEVMLPGPGTVLQEGDVVHVIAVESDLERISAAFARGIPGSRSHGKGSH